MIFFIELKEGLKIAWVAIRANKMRSVLTTLGIVIGIVTVTLMGTAIDGMNRAFRKSISIIGADMLYVSRVEWLVHTEAEWRAMMKRRPITRDQAREVERQMTASRGVSPVVSMGQSVRYQSRSSTMVQISAPRTSSSSPAALRWARAEFISASESDGGRPVAVIGLDVATNLFELESPIGKTIKVGPRSLEVIGVLERQGSFMGMNSLDNEVIIPIQQMMIGYWRNPDFQVQVKATSVENLDETKEELRGLMRKIRRLAPGDPDDFSINQQEQFITLFNRLAGTIGTVGLIITGLSLFVGGIGIMNIMFVSVAERTREIGVRKAIGAKRRTILLQFLAEAASICLLGGLVGLVITYLLTLALGKMMPLHMSLPVMGLALLVSLLTGLISGFLPAWRAARMNPVDALRNE